MVLARVLASPKFIYRIETEPANAKLNTPYRISDLDLASRLSFFLWSTGPDDQLITLASQGRLKDPVVLERQVRRMLKDPRAEALAVNFAGQWLNLRGLQSVRSAAADLSRLRRSAAAGDAARSRAALRQHRPRRSQRRRSADRRTTRSSTSGWPSTTASRTSTAASSAASRSARTWRLRRGLLGKGAFLVDDVEARAHVAGDARQVDHGEHPRHEPAGSAAGRAAAAAARGGRHRQRARADDAAEDAGASRARGLHPVPRLMDPIGFSLENFDGIGAVADAGRGPADRRDVAGLRRHEDRRTGRAAEVAARLLRSVRRGRRREAADVRARPRRRVSGHAARPLDCARCREERQPLLGARPRRRQEQAVSDEHEGAGRDLVVVATGGKLGMYHHQETHPAPDVPAGRRCARWRCRCSTR